MHDVSGTLRARDDGWQAALTSREAEGEVFWRSSGEGWLQADLKRLAIPDAALEAGDGADTPLDSLPDWTSASPTSRSATSGLAAWKPPQRMSDRSGIRVPQSPEPRWRSQGKAQWSRIGGHRTHLD